MEQTPQGFCNIRLCPVLTQRVRSAIDAGAPRAGVEEDEDILSAAGGVDVFILLGDDISSFILNDDQKGIGLQIVQLELEPAVRIRFGVGLDGTADTDNRIDWRSLSSVENHHTGNLGRPARFELVVKRDGKSNDCCD